MEIHRLIFLIVAAFLVVDAKRGMKGRHGRTKSENHFDLVEFLRKVLESNPLVQSELPAAGSLASVPLAGSLGSAPAGSLSVGAQEEQCKDWAGWCKNYKLYCNHATVKKYCKQTCGQCPKPVVEGECKDIHPSCLTGLKWGYCTGEKNQVEFMKKYCKMSCNFCTTVTCVDKQPTSYCKQIKESGHCRESKYQYYFEEHCAKTCGYCGQASKPFTCGVARQRSRTGHSGIVGGVNANKGFFPWQAAIYYNDVFMCGGSLISRRHIVTAAHCFNGRSKDVNKYKIVLGEHNRKYNEGTEQTLHVVSIKLHENYAAPADEYDIAILKMENEAKLDDHVTPACLPDVRRVLPIGTKCYITGWGKTFHDGKAVEILQKVKVPVVEKTACERRNTFNFHQVTNDMICTGFNDGSTFSSGCHGDSGGPLSCETTPGVWTVYGVVSWGSPLCNGLDRYTVFTRVSSYKSWIDKYTS